MIIGLQIWTSSCFCSIDCSRFHNFLYTVDFYIVHAITLCIVIILGCWRFRIDRWWQKLSHISCK